MIDVPVDVYTSSSEIIVVIPVWGTNKESVTITLDNRHLIVRGERVLPTMKESIVPVSEQCFWWSFEKRIELPDHVYFDKIHSELTQENTLVITVPKVLRPDEIPVKIL